MTTTHNSKSAVEGLYTQGKIRTFTGRYIDPFNPKPDDIDIQDIAHALAHQCRFAGHTKRFFSVAEHSINVMGSVSDEHRLAALLHDASEAYLLDIPTPIKNQLPGYREAEDRLMAVIAKKYGFAWPMAEEVKAADREHLESEWVNEVVNCIPRRSQPTYLIEAQFLYEFHDLTDHAHE
jgi:hypothetical protein